MNLNVIFKHPSYVVDHWMLVNLSMFEHGWNLFFTWTRLNEHDNIILCYKANKKYIKFIRWLFKNQW